MQRLVALLLAVVAFPTSFAASPYFATAVSVNGKVYIGKRILKPGDKVLAGEVIHTNSDASIKLLAPDKSVLDLGPSTTMRLEDPEKAAEGVTASLDKGSLRTLVQKRIDPKNKFSIKTKASVLAVRGTEFVVRIGTQGANFNQTVTVASGQVMASGGFGSSGPIALGPGRQMEISAVFQGNNLVFNEPPKVLSLNTAQVAAIVKESTVQDNTFRQQVEITNRDKDDKGSDKGNNDNKGDNKGGIKGGPGKGGDAKGDGKGDGKGSPGGGDKGGANPGSGSGSGSGGQDSGGSGKPGASNGLPISPGGGGSTIATIADGVQDQFAPGRGPASDGMQGPGPQGGQNMPPQPPKIDPLTQLSPALSKGLVEVKVTISP